MQKKEQYVRWLCTCVMILSTFLCRLIFNRQPSKTPVPLRHSIIWSPVTEWVCKNFVLVVFVKRSTTTELTCHKEFVTHLNKVGYDDNLHPGKV